ncbi:MAG: CAAX prenyl protease-related protein [Bryobacteraceae bacterium]
MTQLAERVSGPEPNRETTARYVVPFAVFLGFLALQSLAPLPARVDFPLRVVALAAVLVLYSRPVIELKPRHLLASLAMGVAVFAIWVAPDLLFPHYRQHWLFQNALAGTAKSTLASGLRRDPFVLTFRVLRAVVIVPIVEELFWRGWLMRWLVAADFRRVPLGTYAPLSFWITALMFASEHGPYWDVGLLAGILYNWWAIRTKSLADCILAHAVTNAVLCAWVILAGRWEYWL